MDMTGQPQSEDFLPGGLSGGTPPPATTLHRDRVGATRPKPSLLAAGRLGGT